MSKLKVVEPNEMKDIFSKELNEYEQQSSYIDAYHNQIALRAAKKYNLTYDKALELTKKAVPVVKDPIVHFYERDRKTEDRVERKVTLTRYLNDARRYDYVMSPSLTCYTKRLKSTDARYLLNSKNNRAVFKKRSKKQFAAKDFDNALTNDAIQKSLKILLNAYSGLTTLMHLPVSSHSAHYTLTSITATVTSLGNAMTESLVGGARIYFNKDEFIDDLIMKTTRCDTFAWGNLIKKYGIHIPTDKEIYNMVVRSSEAYTTIPFEYVATALQEISNVERCAYLYTLDLYHFEMLNPKIIYGLFKKLTRDVHPSEHEFDLEYLNSKKEHELTMLSVIFLDELKGKRMDYNQFKGTPFGNVLTGTMRNIDRTVHQYQDMFRLMFRTDFMVQNLHEMKQAYRRAVVLSDTDSIVGKNEHFVKQYHKNEKRYNNTYAEQKYIESSSKSWTVAGFITYITSEVSNHLLSMLACNMNAEQKNWAILAVKNEYMWNYFSPAAISKHYATSTKVNELVVYDTKEVGVSGSTLIATNSPQFIKDARDEITDMIDDIFEKGEKLIGNDVLLKASELEQYIVRLSKEGSNEIFREDRINAKGDYRGKIQASPYFHHMLYRAVFEEVGREVEEPEYQAYSIPVNLDSKKKLNEWLSNLEPKYKEKALRFFGEKDNVKNGGLGRMLINKDIVDAIGIPDYIQDVVDYDKIVKLLMKPVYMVLGMVGLIHDDISDLTISEQFRICDLYGMDAKAKKEQGKVV